MKSPLPSEKLLKLGSLKTVGKGTFLFHKGAPAEAFYYVQSGEILVSKMNPRGNELEVKRFGPGHFVGEVILFATKTFPVSAQAAQKSHVLVFPKSRVINAIEKNPAVAFLFLKILSQKCLALNQRLEMLSLQSIEVRLIRYLLERAPQQAPYRFKLPGKKLDLAKTLGTIPETLSRNFKKLERRGWIKMQGATMHLVDIKQLKSFIESSPNSSDS